MIERAPVEVLGPATRALLPSAIHLPSRSQAHLLGHVDRLKVSRYQFEMLDVRVS